MDSLAQKALNGFIRFHDTVYRRTHGWIGHRMMWIPSLLLHTVGAKTGEPRTAALAYGRDGADYLVTASNGGAARSPGWYHNLKARPDVEVNVGRRRFPATARPVLPDDPDYDRLWKIVNKVNRGQYARYQEQTSRPIPIVALMPSAEGTTLLAAD
ncbi:nitroreductase family deazaflavin-dependent oxidoreductase [Mycobacterium shigaense]|uniref:F420H(2)-dependent quinone reductase n=1 Tax=Mycobacterium shigaense TaxID=722731 RepID=A0A1Z4EL70_9MYCO|nr:nitroreductase family deazaflavin-dependent oxidoreductase [Mycobacterium shigaense]MEA1121224.1 nitroreductase family deazaflavin-dependent oxidoreductase [Mycobacterium shigaense]PRI14433.1 nitroreductase [Mycobacterium shigaense]BAX93666.1 F420H(2)-dependent quinone reductase [Mycobacterium shigaense]